MTSLLTLRRAAVPALAAVLSLAACTTNGAGSGATPSATTTGTSAPTAAATVTTQVTTTASAAPTTAATVTVTASPAAPAVALPTAAKLEHGQNAWMALLAGSTDKQNASLPQAKDRLRAMGYETNVISDNCISGAAKVLGSTDEDLALTTVGIGFKDENDARAFAKAYKERYNAEAKVGRVIPFCFD